MEWININEKAPDYGVRVLVRIIDDERGYEATVIGALDRIGIASGEMPFKKATVTHWMPLPAPPTQ